MNSILKSDPNFFPFHLLLPLSSSLPFSFSHYHLLNLYPGLNGDRSVSRGTIKIGNFRKKDLMRGLGVVGGEIGNYLERNEKS